MSCTFLYTAEELKMEIRYPNSFKIALPILSTLPTTVSYDLCVMTELKLIL